MSPLDWAARESAPRSLNVNDGLRSSAPSSLGALWPHPDLPLFPTTLQPLAGVRSVLTLDGGARRLSDYASVRPTDLSAEELAHVSEQISDLVQTLLYSRKSLSQLAQMRIDVPDNFRLNGLVLSDRARVALQARAFFDPQGQWRHCNLLELVSTHAMGAKLAMAFLLAVEEGLKRHPVQAGAHAHLEQDLEALVKNSLYADRCANIFNKANGWDGSAPQSLALISAEHRISKERARQILSLSNASMDRHLSGVTAPQRLIEALDVLRSAAPLEVVQAQNLLLAKGITAAALHPEGVINAAQRFGIDPQLMVMELANGKGVLLSPQDNELMPTLKSLARSGARSWGLVNADWLLARAHAQGLSSATPDMARLALESESQLSPLDGAAGWFWPGSHLKPSGFIVRCLKIIAYFGRASTAALMQDLQGPGARADLGLPGPLGESVVRSLLSSWGLTHDEHDLWTAQAVRMSALCAQAMPDVERQLAELIRSCTTPMDKVALKQTAENSGINGNTFQSYLKRSALIAPQRKRWDPVHLIDPVLSKNDNENTSTTSI
jgi:hypothetical protein